MKNKNSIWYFGYLISALLILVIFITDFNKTVDIALAILFAAVFSVSHTQILHEKMMKDDEDYKINVLDERNILIEEKAGNITNMFNMVLLGLITVLFIALDYLIPAIVTGMMIVLQPVILIFNSRLLEKKM